MKANYKHLITWIEHNPTIRNIRRFAISLDTKPQRVYYSINNNAFFGDDLIARAREVYKLTDEQVNKFFYTNEL